MGPLLLLTLIGLHARAAAAPAGLTWRAPPPCPDAHEVREAVARATADAAAMDWEASATVERAAPELWTLDFRLTLGDRASQRSLDAASCEELARATVALLGLALSDAAREVAAPTAPQPEATERAAPLDDPALPPSGPLGGGEARPVDAGRPSTEPRHGWGVTTALGVDSGSLPVPAMAFRIGAVHVWENLSLRSAVGYVGAAAEEEQRSTEGTLTETAASAELWVASSAACLSPFSSLGFIAACLGAEAGVGRSTRSSAEEHRSATKPWLAGVAGIDTGYSVGRLRPGVSLEGGLPLTGGSGVREMGDPLLRLFATLGVSL